MMDKILDKLLHQSMDRGTLKPDDIPDLDLYIDQVISLMEKSVGTQPDGQPPLTRTMIHNYSKAGLISPVKGKKYSKEQIMQMFAVYVLKNTLSIAQIKRILCAIDEKPEHLQSCYQAYIDCQKPLREKIQAQMEEIMGGVSANFSEELFIKLLLMADASQMIADYARRITEKCYPEPPIKGKKK